MMTWVEKQAGTRSRRLSFRRVTRDAGEGRVSAMTGLILSQTCETEGCWGLESSVHTIFPAQDSQTSANSLKCTKQKNFILVNAIFLRRCLMVSYVFVVSCRQWLSLTGLRFSTIGSGSAVCVLRLLILWNNTSLTLKSVNISRCQQPKCNTDVNW